MEAKNISFFRKFPLEVRLQNRTSFFYFTAGFLAPIDPDSGMSINMIEVDSWVKECLQKLSQKIFENELDFLQKAFELLKNRSIVRLELESPLDGSRYSICGL